jgi:outer membrane protein TolC
MPDLELQAEVSNVFTRDGVGSELDTSALPASFSGVFRQPEDLSWQVAVSLSYPLFSGGAKFAERSKATQALAQLRLELDSVSEIIEQRIRSAMHMMGASFAGIEQSRAAADAAGRSLALMEDAYSRGGADILDLLDAQNNARVADEVAANAVFDFLIDLMEVERSIGRLVLQMPEQEREAFFGRLDEYFSAAGRKMSR